MVWPCKTSSPVLVEEIEVLPYTQWERQRCSVTVIGVNIEWGMPDLTDEFISDAGMSLTDDTTLSVFNQFTVNNGIPLFVINGVANTNFMINGR